MLELINICKSYEGQLLLNGVSFRVASGETVCLLGASGSGKSTLLRIIAGLEDAEAGQVLWDGEDISFSPPHRRNFGLVFQDYALFPHLNVYENIAFGLRMQQMPEEKIRARVGELLEAVNLTGFEARRVTDLSGGEQQRVALARALAPHPRLLMFDEPLGALDRALKDDLLDELRRTLRLSGIPAIYVTHDQEEAYAIADRILLLHDGCIVQEGSPAEVYARPVSAWAARFLGAGNVLTAQVVAQYAGEWEMRTILGNLRVACGHPHRVGEMVNLMVSRRGVREDPSGNLQGRVMDVVFQQDGFKVALEDGSFFYLDAPARIGEEIRLAVQSSAAQCLS